MTSGDEDKTSEEPKRDSRESGDTIEDLEKYADPLLEEFSKLYSMFLGDRIDLRFTSEENKAKFLNAIRQMIGKNKEIKRIKQSDMPSKEKLVRIVDLWESILRNIAPGMTGGQHFIDWAISSVEATIRNPARNPFLAATRYSKHVQLVEDLLRGCLNSGRYNDVKKFLEDVDKKEMAFSSSQALFAHLIPAYEFLHEIFLITHTYISSRVILPAYQLIAKQPISREDIDKALRYYKDFADEFEKQVRIIVGLLEILSTGIRPDYGKIKGQDLGANLAKVEGSERYRGLVAPFSRPIRNALAHGDHMIDPIQETVGFSDRRGSVTTLGFVDFLRKLADLSGVVLALLSLRINLVLLRLRRIRDAYHQAKKEQ